MLKKRANNDRRSITKIISGLFYIGLIISFVDIFTIAFRTENEQGSLTIVSAIHYIPIILLDTCGLLAFISERKNFPKYVINCFYILIGWMVLLTVRDYPKSTEIGILFSSKGLMTWLICSLIFVTSNQKRMAFFEKLLYVGMLVLVGYGVIQCLSLSAGFSRSDSLKLLLLLMVNLFWVLAYFFLENNSQRNKIILNASLLVLIVVIIFTFTQSYVILFLLLGGLKFYDLRNKAQIINPKSILLLLGFAFVVLVFANSDSYSIVDYAINSLTKRTSESQGSRLDQISEFVAQIKYTDVLFGSGPASTWNWSAREDAYQYIDNQIMLLLWFGGLIPTLMYLIIFIYPAFKVIFSKRKQIRKNTGYIAFLWLLAMSGLAIYTTYSNNFYYYVVCIYAGVNIIKSDRPIRTNYKLAVQ